MVFSLRDGHVARIVSPAPATAGAIGKASMNQSFPFATTPRRIMRCSTKMANVVDRGHQGKRDQGGAVKASSRKARLLRHQKQNSLNCRRTNSRQVPDHGELRIGSRNRALDNT